MMSPTKTIALLAILLGAAAGGCAAAPLAGEPRIGIYLITACPKDSPSEKMSLADFTLAAEPLIAERDISAYDWESHTIRLKQQAVADRILYGKEPDGRWVVGRRFMVVVDGQRLYRGAMLSIASSLIPPVPIINIGPGAGQWQPKFAIRIYPPTPKGTPDPRGDARLKKALQELLLMPNDGAPSAPAPPPAAQPGVGEPSTPAAGKPTESEVRRQIAAGVRPARATDADARDRFLAIERIARLPEAFTAVRKDLMPLLNDPDEAVRFEALRCFAQQKDLAACPVILELLRRDPAGPAGQHDVTVMQALDAVTGQQFGYDMHNWGPGTPRNQQAIRQFQDWMETRGAPVPHTGR